MTASNLHNPPEWIKEAQSRIGEREIKGYRHSPFIQGMLKYLGAWWNDDETPWCLKGDIEVLTCDGFTRFDQLLIERPNAIAMLNPETREVEFTEDWGYIEKDYEGDVVDVKAGRLDFTADPKHRMWGRVSGSGPYKFRELGDLTSYGIAIPTISSGQPDADYSDTEIKFIAAFLSDGYYKKDSNTKQVNFCVSKERKIASLEEFGPLKRAVDKKLHGVTKYLCTTLTFDKTLLREDAFAEYKLLTWDFVRSLSARQAKLFIDTYKDYDGTLEQGGGFTVFTNDKHLAEQLSYLATMAGYKATPYTSDREHEDKGMLYNVYVSMKEHRHFSRQHCTYKPYNGKLYCVQVPTGIFIMRCRNGVIMPIGNCGVFTGYCLKKAGRKNPRFWMRAKAYLDWGTRLDKPAFGCVAVTSRRGGGHVFFVVGKTQDGRIVGLGGNQSDMVCLRAFHPSQIDGYRWPLLGNGAPSAPFASRYDLPIYSNNLSSVTSMS